MVNENIIPVRSGNGSEYLPVILLKNVLISMVIECIPLLRIICSFTFQLLGNCTIFFFEFVASIMA